MWVARFFYHCFGDVDDEVKQLRQKMLILFVILNSCICICVFFFQRTIFFLWCCRTVLSTVKLPVDGKIQSTGRVGELFWRGDMHSLIVDLDPNWGEFGITSGIVYTGKFLMQF